MRKEFTKGKESGKIRVINALKILQIKKTIIEEKKQNEIKILSENIERLEKKLNV